MSIYVFHLNEIGSPDWHDEDFECEGRVEIEQHACRLLDEANARQAARGSTKLRTTVIVFELNGAIILSAHGWPGRTKRILWVQDQFAILPVEQSVPQQNDAIIRVHIRGVILKLSHYKLPYPQ